MTPDIVITGIGAVSSAGFGAQALWEALVEKKPCFATVSLPDGKEHLAAMVKNIDGYLNDKRWRRAAEISKYSIAAIKLALEDAGIESSTWNSRQTGLVTAVTHGAIKFTIEFHASLVKEGPAAASPMVFSDSVLNAPAGNASIAFNIKGAAHTVIGDLGAGIQSISTAVRTMRCNGIKICLAGATEEFAPLVMSTYLKLKLIARGGAKEPARPFSTGHNGFMPGEGACFMVLEEKGSALERGARIYGEIAYAKNPLSAGRSLDTSGMGETIIFAGANGTYADANESAMLEKFFCGSKARPYICCIKPLIGESFAASGMMQIAAAAISLRKGIAPPSNTDSGLESIAWAKQTDAPKTCIIETAIASAAGYNDGGGLLVLRAVK